MRRRLSGLGDRPYSYSMPSARRAFEAAGMITGFHLRLELISVATFGTIGAAAAAPQIGDAGLIAGRVEGDPYCAPSDVLWPVSWF